MLLAAATARPDDLPQMRWLHESDFTVPVHAALFACLTALARRGAPVDPITLLWEAQQRGLLHAGFGPDEVLDLVSHPAGAPEHWGQKILQRALLSQAVTVAARIATLTSDEATSVHQLATGSRRALSALSSVRPRWHHATNDPARSPHRVHQPPLELRPYEPAAPHEPQPGQADDHSRPDRKPLMPHASADAHIRFALHPDHHPAVVATTSGSTSDAARSHLYDFGFRSIGPDTMVLVCIDHEEPYYANTAAKQLSRYGFTVEIETALQEEIDTEWTWATIPSPGAPATKYARSAPKPLDPGSRRRHSHARGRCPHAGPGRRLPLAGVPSLVRDEEPRPAR
ncbi:DnaB-like helicase N-terminal domain-containing protein [Streptomyces sp. MS1.HAVA.3]|uniref:DnaB-like helicase N-terminal domain-containing protein n=1 Tax=Streptomyces caledonius TaxID=3134107 RepID=A0ABU8U0I1_9ACTN